VRGTGVVSYHELSGGPINVILDNAHRHFRKDQESRAIGSRKSKVLQAILKRSASRLVSWKPHRTLPTPESIRERDLSFFSRGHILGATNRQSNGHGNAQTILVLITPTYHRAVLTHAVQQPRKGQRKLKVQQQANPGYLQSKHI